MPPKANSVYQVKPQTLDFESRVDEIAKLVRQFVELKSGFGEDHVKSRTLQNILKQFDIDHTGDLDPEQLSKALDHMNITYTPDERDALFERYDVHKRGHLTFKEFSDAVFGLVQAPCGNPEVRAIVKKFREKMLQRAGDQGVRGLTRTLVVMDTNKNGSLCKEEMFNGLQRYGVQCTLADIDLLIKFLDRDGNGTVSLKEFLRAVRGHLPSRRRQLIYQAFQTLDANGSGVATLEEIGAVYDTSRHPAVLKGTKSAEEVLREFISGWDADGNGKVTLAEFLDYYRDISASIDRDDYFELMMRNCWRLSGGEGQAANTANRRVLVTYKDGHQTIEEIKNDLGIGPRDKDKMKANLEAQGIRDIVRIELYA